LDLKSDKALLTTRYNTSSLGIMLVLSLKARTDYSANPEKAGSHKHDFMALRFARVGKLNKPDALYCLTYIKC
jgi:hypothetical protein